MPQNLRFRKLALFSLTLVLWTITNAGSDLIFILFCYLTALALLWGARFFRLRLPEQASFWIGIALISLIKIPATLNGIVEDYFRPYQQRRSDLQQLDQALTLHPRTIFQSHPQRYHAYAPGAKKLHIKIGSLPVIEATSLSHGAFTFDLTPNETASFPPQTHLDITLKTESHSRTHTLPFIQAQARPNLIEINSERDTALSLSTTTHEAILISKNGDYRTFNTGISPSAGVFTSASGEEMMISHLHGDGIWWIDSETGTSRKKLPLAGRINHLAISPDFTTAAATLETEQPGLVLIQPQSRHHEFFPLSAQPEWVTFGLNGQAIAVSSRSGHRLFILRKQSEQWHLDQEIALLRPLTFLKSSPDGRILWGGSTIDDITSESTEGNHRIVNSLIRFDLESKTFLRPWITEGRTSDQVSPGSFDQGISPMGIDFLKDGKVRVAFAGTSEVIEYDQEGKRLKTLKLTEHFLSAPHSLAHFDQDRWLVSSPAEGALGIFDRESEDYQLLHRIELNPADPFAPDEDPAILERRLGEIGFYESTLAGIACQSCHTHGESDFSFHDIGAQQAYATLSASGTAGTAPYLRDASYPELSSLHDVAEDLYRGYQNDESDEDRPHHLAQFLKSLPSKFPPTAQAPALQILQKGSHIFHEIGCATCHTPPAYTNLAAVPAKRLFPDHLPPTSTWLDTPSLLSLHSSTPYLHDGRATTLDGLLTTQNLSDQHGKTQHLPPPELEALIAFLKQL